MGRGKLHQNSEEVNPIYMQADESKISRRKLVSWLGVLSLFTMAGAIFNPWKNKKPKTVKMLTQDGNLVEIDASYLAADRKKISDKELQTWVKNK
jgi:hypothetical protein